MQTILHLDMDSFFASVEQQANPQLVGKPVGIIKGEGRSCIIAASREAKKLGIKTGTSTYDAKKIYSKIILVPADFDKYFSVTKRFIEICSHYSPDLEVFSIDELFLDVTKTEKLFSSVLGIVRGIKEEIKEELGEYITCSVGISYNRLLAKLASDIKKPNGVFEITEQNKDEVLFKAKLSDVCGLGYRLEKKLFDSGITNFKTLREMPMEFLKDSFGPFWSVELKKLSYGEDDSLLTRVGEIPKMKSVSRTFTLYQNTTDLKIIKATLRNLCEEAAWKARQMGMTGRQVGIAVRGGEAVVGRVPAVARQFGEAKEGGKGTNDYKHKTLRYFIDNGEEIFKIVWRLFEEMKWGGSVRFLGVGLGMLKSKNELTIDLFPGERRKENLVTAMDKVNKKYGELTLYPAVMLGSSKIKSEINGFLGDKSFRFGLK